MLISSFTVVAWWRFLFFNADTSKAVSSVPPETAMLSPVYQLSTFPRPYFAPNVSASSVVASIGMKSSCILVFL